MKILNQVASTLKNALLIAIIWGAYSLCTAMQINLPTFQQVLAANTLTGSELFRPRQLTASTPEPAPSDSHHHNAGEPVDVTADVCALAKLGFTVWDSAGRLNLCIDKGVSVGGAK